MYNGHLLLLDSPGSNRIWVPVCCCCDFQSSPVVFDWGEGAEQRMSDIDNRGSAHQAQVSLRTCPFVKHRISTNPYYHSVQMINTLSIGVSAVSNIIYIRSLIYFRSPTLFLGHGAEMRQRRASVGWLPSSFSRSREWSSVAEFKWDKKQSMSVLVCVNRSLWKAEELCSLSYIEFCSNHLCCKHGIPVRSYNQVQIRIDKAFLDCSWASRAPADEVTRSLWAIERVVMSSLMMSSRQACYFPESLASVRHCHRNSWFGTSPLPSEAILRHWLFWRIHSRAYPYPGCGQPMNRYVIVMECEFKHPSRSVLKARDCTVSESVDRK